MGSGFTFVQDTAPPGTHIGQTWYQSTTGFTYIWIFDGTSNQWVQF